MATADPTVPRLSVVVVSFNAEAVLVRCLGALTAQARSGDIEILVVRDFERAGGRPSIAEDERCPHVRWVKANAGCTVPRMRWLAIDESRGAIVALLEDDCVVEPGWVEAVIAAHRTPDVAIGGAVEPGPYTRALDWGVYFCEFGRFMLPMRRGARIALAGNNVSYKRAALSRVPAQPDGGFYEVLAHWAWEEQGLPMRAEPSVVVRNINRWPLGYVTRVPFHHGRTFAAQRFADSPRSRRAVLGLLALGGLPLVKVARIARDAVVRRRLLGRLVQGLPWIVVFSVSWSIGECVGCLFGPGDSPSRWR
jgi:hypothetical protein